MQRFHNRVRQILMASGSTTFTKVYKSVSPNLLHILYPSPILLNSSLGLLSFFPSLAQCTSFYAL